MTNKPKYDAVLYDFDGTVVDSFPGIGKCVQYALKEEFGIDVPDYNELTPFFGPPLHNSFEQFYNLDAEQVTRAVKKYRERYNTVGLYESEPYAGAKESFERLRAAGVVLAIASSKPTHLIDTLLAHFGLGAYFSAVAGTQHFEGHADPMTKTDSIELALELIGFSDKCGRAVMVGDRWLDAEGANNANVDFIAAAYSPYIEPDEFDSFPFVHKAASLMDIADLVIGG